MTTPFAHEMPRYLDLIGVRKLRPSTSPFDPGYDPVTLRSHLAQSAHLISILKISMACWMIADPEATASKLAAAAEHHVPTVSGGGPFEIAVAQGRLHEYLDLCAGLGFTRIEAGAGFTELSITPTEVVRLARDRGLDVQFEVGKKHAGAFSEEGLDELIEIGQRWLDAGAVHLVIEARESASDVGLFTRSGELNTAFADRFVAAFGMDTVTFEAPNKPSQFAFLDHFGPEVHLSNVRLEELLRVEIYRRGLHSDAFQRPNLRPPAPANA